MTKMLCFLIRGITTVSTVDGGKKFRPLSVCSHGQSSTNSYVRESKSIFKDHILPTVAVSAVSHRSSYCNKQ